MPCAQVVQRSKILPSLVQLLVQGQEALTACGEVVTPKWLAPLLLLIDLLEKVAMCTQRRDKMYKVSGLKICYTGSICCLCLCVCARTCVHAQTLQCGWEEPFCHVVGVCNPHFKM